jgi:SAM-dependent methyltransferase
MTVKQIGTSYSARADEYVKHLGSVSSLPKEDATLIATWGQSVTGQVIDAGSGPGHWTEFLRVRGVDIRGVDLVPEFVDSALRRFPKSRYRVGRMDDLRVGNSELGGILAWYSLIHTHPDDSAVIFREFARSVRSGGSLLIGVFEGAHAVAFDHAVATAYFWSVEALMSALEMAGFSTLEVHTRTDSGVRPHAALIAERVG